MRSSRRRAGELSLSIGGVSKFTQLRDDIHYCPKCCQDWLFWDRKDHSYFCKRCRMHFIVLAEDRRRQFDVAVHGEMVRAREKV